jgi:hypothetical protein
LKLKFGGSGGVFAAEKFALTPAFKWEQPLVWQRAPEGLKTNVRWWRNITARLDLKSAIRAPARRTLR